MSEVLARFIGETVYEIHAVVTCKKDFANPTQNVYFQFDASVDGERLPKRDYIYGQNTDAEIDAFCAQYIAENGVAEADYHSVEELDFSEET